MDNVIWFGEQKRKRRAIVTQPFVYTYEPTPGVLYSLVKVEEGKATICRHAASKNRHREMWVVWFNHLVKHKAGTIEDLLRAKISSYQ